ncbi:hypothetical protein CRUP_020069 [Coryphaenoides rupestris]|nr:hypothetical protein CRUP_020069 [Coryphaenoides rupestris]
MQNFAYLEAKTSALGNGPMEWSPVSYGAGGSVGSNFVFHAEQRALELKRDGSYFLYVDLQLICTTECDATGPVTVSIGKDFTCTVELPKRSGSSGPLSHKCWEVVRMTAGTRLIATMTVPESSPKQWMLDVKKSGQGIFLVD